MKLLLKKSLQNTQRGILITDALPKEPYLPKQGILPVLGSSTNAAKAISKLRH